MDEAIQMAADDPSLVAGILPTYTQLTPEVAASLNPISFAVEDRPADIGRVEELMREYGITEDEVDTDALLVGSD